jgi:N-dimethylarginine dimethylaminohydrolase
VPQSDYHLRMADFGVRSSVSDLRRAALRRPATTGDFTEAGWRLPDPELLARQHDAFAQLLTDLGVQVELLAPTPGQVDAVFAYDPAFVIGAGVVEFRSAKPARQHEGAALTAAIAALGVPTVGKLAEGSVMDGGDVCWIARDLVVAGRGYRTNQQAHDQLRGWLAQEGQQLVTVDLPHDRGPAHVLHLMSGISPITDDLVVVYPPIMPVPLLQLLAERGIATIEVDPVEYETLGGNILAVRPGVVVIFAGNPLVSAAMRARDIDVHEIEASELAKGDGGPTCLTRPLLRA